MPLSAGALALQAGLVAWPPPLPAAAAGSVSPRRPATDWKTLLSLGGALLGAVFLASLMAASAGRQTMVLPDMLFGAYVAWALFWGFPCFWRWWRRSSFGLGSLGHAWRAGFFRIALSLAFLLTGGYFFSVFGGGIYQFVRHRMALRGRAGGQA